MDHLERKGRCGQHLRDDQMRRTDLLPSPHSAQQAGFPLDAIPQDELCRGLMADGGIHPALIAHALKTYSSPKSPPSSDAMDVDGGPRGGAQGSDGLWALDETKVCESDCVN